MAETTMADQADSMDLGGVMGDVVDLKPTAGGELRALAEAQGETLKGFLIATITKEGIVDVTGCGYLTPAEQVYMVAAIEHDTFKEVFGE